jgi:hypothetical protein
MLQISIWGVCSRKLTLKVSPLPHFDCSLDHTQDHWPSKRMLEFKITKGCHIVKH